MFQVQETEQVRPPPPAAARPASRGQVSVYSEHQTFVLYALEFKEEFILLKWEHKL